MFRFHTITALTVLLLASNAQGGRVVAIDGDTVDVGAERVRILNIDTPEIHEAKCAGELERGMAAKRRLQVLIEKAGSIDLERGDGRRMKDRYGRTLARVFLDGRDVGEQLVEEGLARKWNGRRRPWC